MKKKHVIIPTICGLLSMGAVTVAAAKSGQVDIRKELQSVVIPEMPVKAVELVKEAKSSNRAAVAFSVLQESAALNPASLISVVSEIAKAEPKLAGEVAVFAATLQPSQLTAITHAVVKSVPGRHKAVVTALAQAFPMDMPKMAGAAQVALPNDQAPEVFATILEAFPGLKSELAGGEDPNLEILRQILANNSVTVTVSILETSLQVVATQVVAIQTALKAQLTKPVSEGGAGLSSSAIDSKLNFSAIAKKILEGKIAIPPANATGDQLAAINTQIQSELNAEIQAATVESERQTIAAANPNLSAAEVQAQAQTAAVAKQATVQQATTAAAPAAKVVSDPKFTQAKATEQQSKALVTVNQVVTINDDTIRTYSKP